MGWTFTTGTVPTTGQVTQFIADVNSMMDSEFLVYGITVPLTPTNPQTTSLLKTINAWGAAAMAEGTIYTQSRSNESPRTSQWWGYYRDSMARIRDNPAIFGPGSSALDSGRVQSSLPSSFTIGTDQL